jgi:diguanylate cyclase (GGDEF)-like protein
MIGSPIPLARAERKKQEVGIVSPGVDRFHEIKRRLGDEGGDAVLAATADRVKRCMREVDTGTRLSGDVFTCLLEGVTSKSDLHPVRWR